MSPSTLREQCVHGQTVLRVVWEDEAQQLQTIYCVYGNMLGDILIATRGTEVLSLLPHRTRSVAILSPDEIVQTFNLMKGLLLTGGIDV